MRVSIARLIAVFGLVMGALAFGTPASAATVSVANCNDSGSGSLRAVIGTAAAGATITFATDCPASGPIRLTGGSLTLSQSVTIDGTGRHIVIDGNCATDANSDCTGGGNTVFHVTAGTVTFNALTIQHGDTPTSFGGGPPGGGILNDFGRVTVANSTITRNHAAGGGGGIANNDNWNLTVINSTIANNSALEGGGINTGYNNTVTIANSTISNNSSSGGGGIYSSGPMQLNVSNSLIVNNTGYNGMSDDVGPNDFTTDTANLTGSFAFANGETTPQDHGGPTRTLAIPTPANPTAADAYGGGNLAACQRISPAYDQRGAARVVAGKCSIGAFEPGLVNTAATLTANPTTATFGTSVTFSASVSGVRGGTPPDGVNVVTFKNGGTTLGTANLTAGVATISTNTLSPGNSVTATYAAGGTGNLYAASPASNAVSVTIILPDSSPPTTTATLAGTVGSNGWYTSAVTVTLAATDPDGAADVASTTAIVDGGAPQSYTAPFIVSGDAAHTVTFSSTDKAGNVEATKTQTVKIDATAPTAIVGTPDRGPDGGGYYNHSVTVTFAGQDAPSGIATCTTGATYSGPDSATATVPGSCTDNAGNSASGSFALKYDASTPVTTATPDRPANTNGWYNAPMTVTLNATDTLSGVAKSQYKLDTANWADYVPGSPVAVAGDGSHTVLYHSVDNAGNQEVDGKLTIKIDATAPTSVVGAAARGADSNGWYNKPVGITFSGQDSLSNIDTCTSTTYSGPDSASATVSGTCTDTAGNVSAAAPFTFKYDAAAPTAVIGTPDRAPNATGWYNASVTVEFSGQDSVSKIDTCTSTTYSGPDSKTATVSGTCTDTAGNVSAPVAVALEYDATPPTAIVGTPDRAPDSGVWYNKPVAVTFAGTDATSGIASCTTGATYGGPDSAAARVPGACTDTAGNVGTGSFALAYDATAPVTTATPDRPANANGWYNAAVTVTLAATDGLSGVAGIQYNLDGAGWAGSSGAIAVAGDRVHTLLFRATDNAGNREADRSVTIRIDSGVRPVSIAVAPDAATVKVGQGQQLTATGTYADGSTADLTNRITWSSDAPDAATVDATGKVTGKAAGTAHVTATQGAVSGQATVTVSPPALTGVAPAPAPASRPSGAGVPGTPAAPTGR